MPTDLTSQKRTTANSLNNKITLFSCPGKIFTIQEIANKVMPLFSESEQKVLRTHSSQLSEKLPDKITTPLTRNGDYYDNRNNIIGIPSGARSALLPEMDLKIKGCRMEPKTFPTWLLNESFELEISQIPYGTLTFEAMGREILGWCFFKEHSFPIPSTPIAIFEYDHSNQKTYALVSKYNYEKRLEALIDCNEISLHRAIRLRKTGDPNNNLKKEVTIQGLDTAQYIQEKAQILSNLNFKGGFRGILNSNLGNDVTSEMKFLGICDFDTFFTCKIPEREDKIIIRNIIINGILELVKSSLPFIDFLDFKNKKESEIHKELTNYYVENSSLFSAYKKLVIDKANELKWDLNLVNDSIDEAFKLPVCFKILQELIPNSFTLSEFKMESHYSPHYPNDIVEKNE
jgi:hypothetical protein